MFSAAIAVRRAGTQYARDRSPPNARNAFASVFVASPGLVIRHVGKRDSCRQYGIAVAKRMSMDVIYIGSAQARVAENLPAHRKPDAA
jgi:hypothetical protein